MCRLESQAAENVALKQRAEGYRKEAGALESRLALIKAQRNKLLVAFEGLAGLHRHQDCIRLLPHANVMSAVTVCLYGFAVKGNAKCPCPCPSCQIFNCMPLWIFSLCYRLFA